MSGLTSCGGVTCGRTSSSWQAFCSQSATALIATAALAAGGGAGKQGGTLRINVSGSDIQSIDPGVDYEFIGWAVELATCLKLVNYPDKPGRGGNRRWSRGGHRAAARIRRRQDLHVHDPAGLQRSTPARRSPPQTFAHVINRDLRPHWRHRR